MKGGEVPLKETFHDEIEFARFLQARSVTALIDKLKLGEREPFFELLRYAWRRDVVVRTPDEQNRPLNRMQDRAQVVAFRWRRHPHQTNPSPTVPQALLDFVNETIRYVGLIEKNFAHLISQPNAVGPVGHMSGVTRFKKTRTTRQDQTGHAQGTS